MTRSAKGKRGTNGDDGIKPFLTVGETCRILNIHGNTLRRWSELGLVRAYRVGLRGTRRFKREDIVALLSSEQIKARHPNAGRLKRR